MSANINIVKTDVQRPIAVSIDSVYGIDIDTDNSTIGTFSGSILSLFNDYQEEIADSSVASPKWFEICFKRPICSDKIVLCSKTNNFSNCLITFLDASDNVIATIDDSDNNEKYNCKDFHFVPLTFIKLRVEFHTTDGVTIAGICLNKTLHVSAQLFGFSDKTGLLTPVTTDDGSLDVQGVLKLKDSSNQMINPATIEKQEIIIEKQEEILDKLNIGDYYTNDIDNFSEVDIMYIGKEKRDGTWLIMRIDMVNGTVIRGANIVNNSTYENYSTAWDNRLSLNYDYLKNVL